MNKSVFVGQTRKDLRKICKEKYGGAFARMFDMLADGKPIGDAAFTAEFCKDIERAAKEAGYEPKEEQE